MNKKSLLGLILAACVITALLFAGATYLIGIGDSYDKPSDQASITQEDRTQQTEVTEITVTEKPVQENASVSKAPEAITTKVSAVEVTVAATGSGVAEQEATSEETKSTFSTSVDDQNALQLIYDCNTVDYQSYIPEMKLDRELEVALDIENPDISVDAAAAILFNANTKEILYYKNAVQAMFPASTAKLLTALVALDWCTEEEEVTIGDEITMIASDSTRAYLRQGEVLTIKNLFAAMLLPSGNDAAYAIAAYVGRKSLRLPEASKEEAVMEFTRLMNKKAGILGVKNSCFKTPDGYDAIGQFTTAYDMGLIGMAAAGKELIIEVSSQGSSRNIFPSGEDVTWTNTNKLVKQYSGQFYSPAIGLKTGTSTMAGRCLVAAARNEEQTVVCVIMDSSSAGRWEDAITLLKYGLKQ